MDNILCEECGGRLSARSDEELVRCPACDTPAVPELRRRRTAAERLEVFLLKSTELGTEIRVELLDLVREEIESLRAAEGTARDEAREAPPAEKPEPPTGEPAAPDEPAPPPVRRPAPAPRRPPRKPREPGIWSKLGPVFQENLLFALAAFLLVAGAVYFVTTAWTTMSGAERRLVVVGGLGVLGGILWAASRLVNRDGELPQAERLLLLVVAFLVPVAAAPTGELFSESLALAAGATLFVLGLGFLAVRAMARAEDPALDPGLPIAVVSLSGLILLGPRAAQAPMSAGAVAALVVAGIALLADRRVVPALGTRLAPVLKAGLLLGFAAVVFAAVGALSVWREGGHAPTALAIGGIVLAGLSVAAAMLEASLGRADRLPADRKLLLLLTAVALAIAGVAIATGNERGFLAAGLFGAAAAILAGLRAPAAGLLVPGLVLSVLAYLYLPAPVRELASRGRDLAARGLGYEPSRFPISFYGVTFLPYVAAVGAFGVVLRRLERENHARVVLGWTFVVSAGLAGLAIFAGADPRAPAAVLTLQGALLLALAPFARVPRLASFGVVGVLAGIHCALAWLAPPTGIHVLVLVLAAAGFLGLARRLASRKDGMPDAVVDGVLATAGLMTLVLLHGLFLSVLPERAALPGHLGPGGAWDLAGYPALALLLVVLAAVYRRPELAAAAFLPLLRVAQTATSLVGAGTSTAILAVALSAAAVVGLVLLTNRFATRLPGRETGASLDPRSALPGGVTGMAAVAMGLAIGCASTGALSAGAPIGLLALSALLFVCGRLTGQPWAAAPAAVLVPVAGVAAAGWAGGDFLLAPGLVGAAAGLGLVAAALRRLDTDDAAETTVVAPVLPVAAVTLAAWAALLLTHPAYRGGGWAQGTLLAAAGAVLAASCRLLFPVLERRTTTRFALAAAAAGAAAVALVPVGLLDAFQPRLDLYPLGLLLAAAATALFGLGNRIFAYFAVGHLAAALAVALLAGIGGAGDGRLLLLAFAGVFEGGRIAARPLPRLGGLLLLLAALGGVSFALGERILHLHPRWQPPIWLLFAAGALIAHRVPRLRVHRVPARIVAIPILVLATIAGFAHAAVSSVIVRTTEHLATADLVAAAVCALAYVAAVFALFGRRRTRARVDLTAASLLLAVFAFPLVNILLHGNWSVFHRPDVEIALVAAVFAARSPAGKRKRSGWSEVGILLGIALLLTTGDFQDVSTPFTVLAACAAPLVLFRREEGEGWLDAFGHGLLLAVLAFAAFLVPKTGRPVPEIFPLFALLSALFAAGVRPALRILPGVTGKEGAAVRVPAAAGLLAPLFVAANAVLLRRLDADGGALLLSFAACATAVGVFGVAFRRSGSLLALRGCGAAAVALYVFLAVRTPFLNLLDGLHLHVLAAAGLALLLLAERSPDRLKRTLTTDGLLAPIPAVLLSLPALAGTHPLHGHESSALFLAAAIYGIVGVRRGRPELVGVSAGLVNLALFTVWRSQGIFDPAFYGVPPGLTLLVGAEVLRDRLKDETRLLLMVTGGALLYGSVGVQVLRVEEPVHALVLFALGLLTVGAGFWRNRTGYLTLGAVVVVLDVIAYLARHGFEESFLAAGLLVLAGLTVLGVAIASSRRRRT